MAPPPVRRLVHDGGEVLEVGQLTISPEPPQARHFSVPRRVVRLKSCE